MTKRRARLLFAAIVTVIIAATSLLYPPLAQKLADTTIVPPGFYKVTYDYDGDTVAVNMNGTEEKVRLIGVDTPETHKPGTPVQCFGPQASDYTKSHLLGQNVRLVADPLDDNRDRYGRLLRYVYLADGTLWDQKLIEQGYGFAYLSFAFTKASDFAAAQATARSASRGLWAACQPVYSAGRWQSQ